MGWTRRAFLGGAAAGAAAGAVGGALAARAVGGASPPLAGVALADGGASDGGASDGRASDGRASDGGAAGGTLDDASGLSRTPVRSHLVMREDPGEALVAALRRELALARAEGHPVNVGAARHSMGAHAIPRDGRAVTLDNGWIEADRAAGTYRVHAGARWRQVIAALDPLGLSPKVMQSNHDFGVAATFSVNAHGWPTAHPPMGGTVRSVRVMLADGEVVEASREENPRLFAAAVGGYGLVGLLLELTVEAAPNALLEPAFEAVAADGLGPALEAAARAGPMAYGRLNVEREGFFERGLLVAYAPVEGEEPAPAEGSGWLSRASRPIFRAQVGNEWVKGRRWWAETALGPRLAGRASRNSLLNEPVLTLDDRDPSRTDILHEYFVPVAAWPGFLEAARAAIPGSYQELLNVTVRWVERDDVSLLAYAPDGPRLAAVLLFSQEMSARAEADMARLTREMIDAVLGLGGSYYLPYRPHATVAQFRRAYPRWEGLAALKREVDPGLLLRNGFWDNYLAGG